MKEKTQKNSLIEINETSIFYKIKKILKKLFNNKEKYNSSSCNDIDERIKESKSNESIKNSFVESIKIVEDEETILLKLQKKYRKGEIKEKDLTEDQIKDLCSLYDKQIKKLRESNQIRKQRLLKD